ncbi:MAG: OmpH family outer membrane protein [Candidatus Cyclobacteriaceae bacterium M2_1C_046]
MKSLSIILNVVLIIAVGILYYLHFSSQTLASQEAAIQDSVATESPVNIAYVNADTVLQHFEFFQEKRKELEAKQQKLENEYRNRAQGLQTEVSNFQQSLPNLTMGQAKALEEDLMKKQQNLRVYQESLTQELMKEESKINIELYDRVTSFIEDYSAENDLELVVKYNQGSDILYASGDMEITWKVVEGLNKKYQEEKNISQKK